MISLAALILFVVHELHTREPVVHLRVFKDRTYAAGVFLMTMLGFVLYGSLLLLPIFLQTMLGYPALNAGIAMAPRGLGSFLMMPLVGTVMGRFDPRKVLAVGLVGASWTLYELSRLNLNAGYWDIFWPQFVQGAALAMLFVPLTTATMDPIPKEEMGNATSMFNLMRNLGGGFGIAAATTFLFRRQQFHTQRLGEHVSMLNAPTQAFLRNSQSRDDGRTAATRRRPRRNPISRYGARCSGNRRCSLSWTRFGRWRSCFCWCCRSCSS